MINYIDQISDKSRVFFTITPTVSGNQIDLPSTTIWYDNKALNLPDDSLTIDPAFDQFEIYATQTGYLAVFGEPTEEDFQRSLLDVDKKISGKFAWGRITDGVLSQLTVIRSVEDGGN